jgi:hypothetical protein
MRNIFDLIVLLALASSCQNKELSMEDLCAPESGHWTVLVRVNWDDHERDSRHMRMSLFSQNEHPHVDRESIDKVGHKRVTLPVGCCYRPLCYDYYANNVYFRNETDHEAVEAYTLTATRATYSSRATPVEGETTVSEAHSFHMDVWDGTFDIVETPDDGEELVMDFYPVDVMREFTFCIRGVIGAKNISDARGAISGMAASMYLVSGELNPQRSTVLFEDAAASGGDVGTITGRFYTFGPIEPYLNRFTIEVMSKSSQYFTAYWDVSGQIGESMDDRDAKLARDGYDILIDNDPNGDLPPIPDPQSPNYDSGFDIDVGEWDNVVIHL